MADHIDKSRQENVLPIAASLSSTIGSVKQAQTIVNNRPEAVAQKKLQSMADNSAVVKKVAQLQSIANQFVSKNNTLTNENKGENISTKNIGTEETSTYESSRCAFSSVPVSQLMKKKTPQNVRDEIARSNANQHQQKKSKAKQQKDWQDQQQNLNDDDSNDVDLQNTTENSNHPVVQGRITEQELSSLLQQVVAEKTGDSRSTGVYVVNRAGEYHISFTIHEGHRVEFHITENTNGVANGSAAAAASSDSPPPPGRHVYWSHDNKMKDFVDSGQRGIINAIIREAKALQEEINAAFNQKKKATVEINRVKAQERKENKKEAKKTGAVTDQAKNLRERMNAPSNDAGFREAIENGWDADNYNLIKDNHHSLGIKSLNNHDEVLQLKL